VVLYGLKRMRDSELYREAISMQNIERLASKYYFQGSVGDQVNLNREIYRQDFITSEFS
jgi:hypothetical protein